MIGVKETRAEGGKEGEKVMNEQFVKEKKEKGTEVREEEVKSRKGRSKENK